MATGQTPSFSAPLYPNGDNFKSKRIMESLRIELCFRIPKASITGRLYVIGARCVPKASITGRIYVIGARCGRVSIHSYETFSKLCIMIPNTFSFFWFNQIGLPQFVINHWCFELIYQTYSHTSTHIVHWITSNSNPQWTKFTLSELINSSPS